MWPLEDEDQMLAFRTRVDQRALRFMEDRDMPLVMPRECPWFEMEVLTFEMVS